MSGGRVGFENRVGFGNHVVFGEKYTDQKYSLLVSLLAGMQLCSYVGIGESIASFLKE